jgi:hypothetical protein
MNAKTKVKSLTLTPLILSIKEKAVNTPLRKVMKELNATEYDLYYVGWEGDARFWMLQNGLMITTSHSQVVEFTQKNYKAYKEKLKSYISNLPKLPSIDPWVEMKKLKKTTIANKKELTVNELIDKLKELPQNVKILVDGYESGLDSIVDAYPIHAKFQEKSNWWDGIYKEIDSGINTVYLKSTRRMGDEE